MNSYTFEDGECRMCGNHTNWVVNINLKGVSICDDCCNTITKQTVIEKCQKENEHTSKNNTVDVENMRWYKRGKRIALKNEHAPREKTTTRRITR